MNTPVPAAYVMPPGLLDAVLVSRTSPVSVAFAIEVAADISCVINGIEDRVVLDPVIAPENVAAPKEDVPLTNKDVKDVVPETVRVPRDAPPPVTLPVNNVAFMVVVPVTANEDKVDAPPTVKVPVPRTASPVPDSLTRLEPEEAKETSPVPDRSNPVVGSAVKL